MTGPVQSDLPLAGRRVLLTRPRGSGAELLDGLEALGAQVDWRPAIAFTNPDEPSQIERALDQLAGYEWLVFTSANGVRFFGEAMKSRGLEWDAFRGALAAVGPATEQTLVALGLGVQAVSESASAEGLARALRQVVHPGQRVLVVRPEVASDVLVKGLDSVGAVVDSVAFYRTVAADGLEQTRSLLATGHYDVAVFTSPSAFRFLCGESPCGNADPLATTALVAIGESTATQIRDLGYRPRAIAATPTREGLQRAILISLGVGDGAR